MSSQLLNALNVVAGAITIFGVFSKALDQVQSICDAPQEVQAILEEISDLQLIPRSPDLRSGGHLSANPNPSKAVDHVVAKVKELQSILHEQVILSSSGPDDPKISSLQWIRHRSAIKSLRSQIQLKVSNLCLESESRSQSVVF
jgi:hypothetical protein